MRKVFKQFQDIKEHQTPHTLSLSKGLSVRLIQVNLHMFRTRETLRQAQGVRPKNVTLPSAIDIIHFCEQKEIFHEQN